MTRARLAALPSVLVDVLAGCAVSPMVTPSPAASSVAPAPVTSAPVPAPVPPSVSASSSGRVSSATPSAAATTLKRFATATLPAQVAGRRTDQVAQTAGGQTGSYYLPMATADVIVAALSPIGTAADAASRLTAPQPNGPATCGTLPVAGKPTGACVVPLDLGFLVVNGSGGQSVDLVARFTLALYDTLP